MSRELVADAVGRILKREGYHVTPLSSVGGALDVIRHEHVDLVVLHMPERTWSGDQKFLATLCMDAATASVN